MKTLKLVAAIAALTGSMSVNAANIDLFTDPAGTTKVSLNAQVNSTSGSNADTDVTDSTGTSTNYNLPFSSPNVDLTSVSTDFKESGAGAASILGGYRDMEVKLLSLDGSVTSGGSASLKVNQDLVTGAGRLTFSSDDGIKAQGIVQWDGNDNSRSLNTAGLDKDLTDGGTADHFVFNVISADQDFDFSIALYDNHGSSVIFDLPATTGPHTSSIYFSSFNDAFALTSGCTSAGSISGLVNKVTCTKGSPTTTSLDFTHISAMQVILNTGGVAGTGATTTSLDMTIAGITTVPEPSSVALIGLGLLASGFAGKRKSKKA